MLRLLQESRYNFVDVAFIAITSVSFSHGQFIRAFVFMTIGVLSSTLLRAYVKSRPQ